MDENPPRPPPRMVTSRSISPPPIPPRTSSLPQMGSLIAGSKPPPLMRPLPPSPSSSVRHPINETIANRLLLIATYYEMEPEKPNSPYKASVYRTASERIRALPTPLQSGAEARRLPGIGPSISADIQSFLTTGRIPRLEELEERHREEKATIDLFMTVHGIGIVSATKYYMMGFRSIEDLLQSAPLTRAQRLAATHYAELRQRIPREEIDRYREHLQQIFSTIDPTIRWMIVGSYRRGESSSGDIDVLVQAKPGLDLRRVVELLGSLVVGALASGQSKALLIVQQPECPARRLDLLVIPPESWAYALLYFTGSVEFNRLMRTRALELGLTLNEYRLLNRETGEFYSAETEEEVFNILGIRYLTPAERTRNLTEI